MKVSLTRREKIGRYFLNLVRMKIAGEITQAELVQRSSRRPEEQLLLGLLGGEVKNER